MLTRRGDDLDTANEERFGSQKSFFRKYAADFPDFSAWFEYTMKVNKHMFNIASINHLKLNQ